MTLGQVIVSLWAYRTPFEFFIVNSFKDGRRRNALPIRRDRTRICQDLICIEKNIFSVVTQY